MHDIPVKFRFVADKEHGPPVLIERLLQCFFSVCIQVVRGLVQHKCIGLLIDQLAQAHLCLLPAA